MITIKAFSLDSSQYLDHNQGMIHEYICYKCKCDKCGKDWITKSNDVPKVCPKCHSVKWNELSPPAPQMDAIRQAETAQPSQLIPDEPKDALAAFIAKAQAKKGIVAPIIATEPAPMDEWIGWGREEQTYDDQTGEMRTFRRHIKTGRVKWIDSETALISV